MVEDSFIENDLPSKETEECHITFVKNETKGNMNAWCQKGAWSENKCDHSVVQNKL